MTDERSIAATWLRRVLLSSDRRGPEVTGALRLLDDDEASFPVRSVSRTQLERTYTRRLSRPGFEPSSMDGLGLVLEALADYRGEELLVVTVVRGAEFASIWLNETGQGLVAALHGTIENRPLLD